MTEISNFPLRAPKPLYEDFRGLAQSRFISMNGYILQLMQQEIESNRPIPKPSLPKPTSTEKE